MRIVEVKIEHFRSANNVHIEAAGALNVFIGKNNSGKSTILSAMDAFFKCLPGGNIVALNPPLGRRVDFHDQDVSLPITITMQFDYEEQERSALLSEIVSEAPQLKNLVESLGLNLVVEIAITFTPEPEAFAYVNSITLIGKDDRNRLETRSLLSISAKTARELATRSRNSRNSETLVSSLSRLLDSVDDDDFLRFKSAEGKTYLRYMLTGKRFVSDLPTPVFREVESLAEISDSLSEFRSRVRSLRERLISEPSEQKAPLNNVIQTFSGDQRTVPNYAANLLRKVGELSVLFISERREPVGKPEALQLLQYKQKRGGLVKLSKIQEKIFSMLNVQIDAFQNEEEGERSELSAEMDVDNFLLEVNGSGIKEALRLVLDVELKAPKILLVEEPEVHLHPGLETNLMRYLREASASCQVFLTTHSTNFLDSPTTDNIYLVKKVTTETSAKLLDVEEAEQALPQELGLRLSSLFMFERLIFVEGTSDEQVLRELAEKIGLSFAKANAGFVHMGGSRNFGYFANQAMMDFMSKRQVKVFL